MNPECQTQECTHFPTGSLATYLTTLSNSWGHSYLPIFFYPPRTVSCDAVCFSPSPAPALFLARVRLHQPKKVSESAYPLDLPQCPGLLRCLHSDRSKQHTRPACMLAAHVGDPSTDTCIIERTIFPYRPLTHIENLVENQNLLIPACALQARNERGAQAPPFSPAAIRQILCPLADTLIQLHRAGFAHNNVRPENVLISADFAVYLHGIDSLPSNLCDHIRWRSPELAKFNGQPAREDLITGDVWAFGCVAFYLATRNKPFHDEADSLTILSDLQLSGPSSNPLSCQSLTLAERISNAIAVVKDADLRELLTKCLTIDATKRPTMESVRACSFLNCVGNPYTPTTYGALMRSTQANLSEPLNSMETYDAVAKAVTDIFSEETLGLPGIAIMTKNATLLSILGPILEEAELAQSTAGATPTNSDADSVFAKFSTVPGLGVKEPLVALPLLDLIREFPTSCALNFSIDAFASTCDDEFYRQCVAHADLMLQNAPQPSVSWSAEESKDYVQHSVVMSSLSASNCVLAVSDCVFASGAGPTATACRETGGDDDELESNVIESGVLALHDSADADQTAIYARDEHKVEIMLRDVEAVQARNRRRHRATTKRIVLIISIVMLCVVIVVVVTIAVVFSRH